MKTTAIVAAFTSLLTFTSAAPAADIEDRAAPALFKLKAVSSDARFNNLCLVTYHTGAGTADATFIGCNGADNFYQNGTRISTTAYGSNNPPAGIQAGVGIDYNAWYPVTIDITEGPGTPGFKYSTTDGYTFRSYPGGDYNSFIACNWAHPTLTPQLFLLAQDLPQSKISANCGFIKLVKA